MLTKKLDEIQSAHSDFLDNSKIFSLGSDIKDVDVSSDTKKSLQILMIKKVEFEQELSNVVDEEMAILYDSFA